jgi:hypothetical protein
MYDQQILAITRAINSLADHVNSLPYHGSSLGNITIRHRVTRDGGFRATACASVRIRIDAVGKCDTPPTLRPHAE